MFFFDVDIYFVYLSVIIDADVMFFEDISYFGYFFFRRLSFFRLGLFRGNFVFIFLWLLIVWRENGRIYYIWIFNIIGINLLFISVFGCFGIKISYYWFWRL